jgi:hypothetical protein
LALGLNVYLFISIDISFEVAAYLEGTLVSIVLLLFFIDPLLALGATITLKRGLVEGSKNVFVFGFIGFKWLRCLN